MSFLKAEWRKLAFANYEVNPSLLEKYVPPGTEIDLFEGKCFVSLVGLLFLNTKILGIKVPFHTKFEEVNLRFYVKRFDGTAWKRGTVFIKEIVSKPAITFVANTLYKENYETLPMKYQLEENSENRTVEYQWKKKNIWHKLRIIADLNQSEIPKKSETEFITEHYWGYAKVNNSVTNEYQVTHPRWKQYQVKSSEINVDFEIIYGKDFAFLSKVKPTSIQLIEGSTITVEGKTKIETTGL